VELTIARPRAEVADFAMDPANDTRWILALRSARTLTGGEVGEGTQVERVASFLGRRIVYVNEIVTLAPRRRLEMRSIRGPFPMTVAYEFEDAGERSTRVRIRAGGDTGGFYRVAGPVLAAAVRRGIARDLAALKRLLEERS
jgi:hypothetical protein